MYVCAVVASSTAVSDPGSARRLGNASIGLSVAGIVVTVVIIVIAVAVIAYGSSCALYSYNGRCYTHRQYVGYFGSCYGERTSDGYCYYN